MNNHLQQTDALIIGFGKAGKTLAAYLGNKGWKVVIAEQSDKMYGGSCINIACIPTKSLIYSAEKQVPYATAIAEKNRLTTFLRAANLNKVSSTPGVTVLTGKAAFVNKNTVNITTADGVVHTFQSEHIFINTGSLPFIPPISGAAQSKRIYSSTTLMELSVLPRKMVIIGGGFIGLEFASMYAQYGTEVAIVDKSPMFLPSQDRDMADDIYQVMTRMGIRIYQGCDVLAITKEDADMDRVVFRDHEQNEMFLPADAILMAVGRIPNTAGLNLDAAGVETTGHGFIKVDELLKTNVPGIWALGDINGGPQFTYISLDDFRIVRDQLFGDKHYNTSLRKDIPTTVFITPPLAHVGLYEHEARAAGYDIKVKHIKTASLPRARIMGQTAGALKATIDSKTGIILGCTLFCTQAGEMINIVKIAMDQQLHYSYLRDNIFTHPSMSEAFNDLFSI
jgi:pyruvate/2-oxoglutarate dehydrogenase complex dihydrolipoamide dehydrogenase (E3) component